MWTLLDVSIVCCAPKNNKTSENEMLAQWAHRWPNRRNNSTPELNFCFYKSGSSLCRIICGFWLTKRRKQHGTCQDIDVHSAALAAADGHIDRLRRCAHIRWKWWVLSDIFFRLKLASPCPQNESSWFHLWQSWNRFIRLIVTSNGFQWFLFFFGRGNTFRSKKKMTTRFQLLAWETVKQFWASEKKILTILLHPSGCVMRWGTIFVGCNNPKIWNFRRQNLCSSSISEGENNILSKNRQMFWFIIWQRPFYDFLRIFVSFNCKIVVFWKWTGPLTVFFNLEENMILTTSRNVLCSRQRKPTKKNLNIFLWNPFPSGRTKRLISSRTLVSICQSASHSVQPWLLLSWPSSRH